MELSLGVLSWWIILAMVVAIAIIRIVLRDRARSIEGMNEDQKATIVFQTVGSKRLKVRYAQLEIFE